MQHDWGSLPFGLPIQPSHSLLKKGWVWSPTDTFADEVVLPMNCTLVVKLSLRPALPTPLPADTTTPAVTEADALGFQQGSIKCGEVQALAAVLLGADIPS
jgi:hypothetical protein